MKYKNSKKELEFGKEEIPEGWVRTTIEQIGIVVTGNTPSKKDVSLYGDHIPFFKPTDLNSGYYVNNSIDQLSKKGLSYARLIPKNSIMVTSIGSIGKVGFNRVDGTTNQQINSIIPDLDIILAEYLYFVCIAPQFQSMLLLNTSSTTLPIINKSKFSKLNILIPPLSEQKRIVQKIESIFSQIDAAKEKLERLALQISSASGSLAQLKSSVLKQAFEGKLVQQDPNDESAEILLKKIHKDSKNKLEFENEGLPDGWIRTKMENVCKTTSGGTPSRKNSDYYDGKIPWLKSGELKDVTIFETEEQISQAALDNSNAKMFPKDTILMAMYGATIGKLGILGITSSTNQAICAFLDIKDTLNKSFLFYFLLSSRRKLTNRGFGGAQNNISQTIIKNLPIPIPPLIEQKRIVSKIESIFAKIDARQKDLEKLEAQLKSVPESINMLKSSILKLAFEGKLVPQDPNDEHASILLEKLKLKKA